MTGVEERAAAVREVCHRYQRMTGRNPVGLGDIIRILVGPDMAPLMADLLAQPTADEAEGDELTQDERRDLGCHCTRLDDKWHHVRGCVVPGVEILLKRRAALTTPPAPERNGLGGGSDA